ncbi:hypothetical protein LSH36_208g00025 [Paralvinella palmiformis]|uniref:Folliculin n=1 Tax=Paralvinella palmiformis TaxID=53620 RepID=A0AAD9JP49_9ANNE|nr:hypothetical protein LSH36_208g00025 [Paralvinella palmiformis]
MNAIIALCHFCENHGPSIIFCTQVFHSESLLKSDTSLLLEDGKCSEESLPTGVPVDKNINSSVSKVEVKCEACRSLPVGLSGYRSNDREANVSYISSQHPNSHQVFSMVRQACVRSLSSEVSPGRDGPGPIFFGDDSSGYVFSHTFIIKDSQYSRGFQRRKLHQTFTWLLKAGGNRLTEKLLEGPPTEDSIIDVEKQEGQISFICLETEEGFVLLTSIKDSKDEQVEQCIEPENVDMDCPVFTNVRHLLKMLGYSQFHTLAHHVVIGNQVIVQGHRPRLVRSIIDCLKTLLPKGCCKVIYYANVYEDAWRCNFLGVTPSTSLPEHIEHYVLISIHEACHDDFGPVILSKMEYALMDDNLADSVVDQCLLCLKEEWMNKVKVLFKFTKAGGSRSVEDTRELLHIVGAQEQDKVVLQFWRTGLSAQYRHHMLSSAVSNAKC